MERNGRISISQPWRGAKRTRRPCRRARPAMACGCSTISWPRITRVDREGEPVMTEIGFYHLTRSTLGEALPRLLERALAAGHRILLKAPNPAEVERLNKLLWTYDAASFLPHGSAEDGWSAEQPIYLTAGDENPAGAGLGCQCGGAEGPVQSFTRAL